MSESSDRLQQARREAGYASATDAARAFGWNVPTYLSHENGGRGISVAAAERYAAAFKVEAAWILAVDSSRPSAPATPDIRPRSGYNPPPDILGARDLPVFASVECGDGSMVVSTDPIDFVPRPWYLKQVKDGYAVLVNGSSMEPAYFAGDLAIVNPKAALVRGKDVIIVGGEEHGEFKASLKRYLGENPAEWFLEQYNPAEGEERQFRRFKHEWPRALRVVGRYDGG